MRAFLFLFYGDGVGPRGTRLCGVHVDAATWRPQEHPWWASRPGLIDEARLFVRGSRVTALYRGGGEGDRLLEVDVSEGQWARQARPGRPRARLGPTALFGGRLVGDELRVVTQGAPTPADGSGR